MNEIEWWAYVHVNGSLQVKRFFDLEDIMEAQRSDFVERVFGPVPVGTRSGAIAYFTSKMEVD